LKYLRLFETFSSLIKNINIELSNLYGTYDFEDINNIKYPTTFLSELSEDDKKTLKSSLGISIDFAEQIIREESDKRNPPKEKNIDEEPFDEKIFFEKNIIYFLRWSDDPSNDIERNFSGHLQTWVDTKEEAKERRKEEMEEGRTFNHHPKQDPFTGQWNYDPEWGISGYLFDDKKSFIEAIEEIKDIAYFHEDGRGQSLYLFSANEIGDEYGYDGENLFRDIKLLKCIDKNDNFKDIFKF